MQLVEGPIIITSENLQSDVTKYLLPFFGSDCFIKLAFAVKWQSLSSKFRSFRFFKETDFISPVAFFHLERTSVEHGLSVDTMAKELEELISSADSQFAPRANPIQ